MKSIPSDSGLSKAEKQKYSVNLIGPIGEESARDGYFIKDITEYQAMCAIVEGKY